MKKILLVDDLGIDVMLTRMALERRRCAREIVVAGDGEEAFRLVREQRFDAILLDIKMPRVDGFELLERLHDGATALPPVIMVSGSGLQADRERAHALGATEYVQKAVDYSTYRDDLEAALARHGLSAA